MEPTAGLTLAAADRGLVLRRPDASYSRALWVGLAVSALVHLWLLAIYPSLVRLEELEYVPLPAAVPAAPAAGLRAIGLLPVEGIGSVPNPQAPVEVAPLPAPAAGAAGRAPRVGESFGPGLVPPGPTEAERFRPSLQDRRLWAPLDRGINDLTAEQRMELDLTGRIAEWQDSMAAAEAAERALTDWTRTDAQGRKWGVSEGQLHLGDVTLPLPFAFGTPVGRRDEIRQRAWEWEEITRGAAGGQVRDSWKDRAKAIRERRDRERAQAKPDTSRIRR
ncbi:MAG: hypothetical protein FIA95_04990 [Gemmatimonadetes bacterium]|nr:hypothetical protein [Gemmatimonadota bacterium]